MKPRMRKVIWIAPLAIAGMVGFVALGGVIVRELWNWLLPGLFGWSAITFWQALGLLLLCRILFGGHGFLGRGGSGFRRRRNDRCGHMTPEERARVRDRMVDHFGDTPRTAEGESR